MVQGDQPLSQFFIERMKSRGVDIFNKLRQVGNFSIKGKEKGFRSSDKSVKQRREAIAMISFGDKDINVQDYIYSFSSSLIVSNFCCR